MPIIKDGKNISAIYKGNIPIAKIYKGANVVWEAFKTLMLSGVPPLSFTGVEKPLIDYKIYGNSKQKSILPDEYQQVEYIEATGTQYFSIPYIANQNTNSKGTFQITDIKKANFLFGARVSATAIGCYGLNWGGGTPYKYYNTYYGNSNDGMTNTNIDDQKHTFEKIRNSLYIDGTLIHTRKDTDGTIDFETPNDMVIFACNTKGTIGLQTYSRLSDLSFNEGAEDLFNLIACYRKSDGEIGMYDIVNKVFYTNQGTGEFLKGNDIITNPTSENTIYLKSVGDKTSNLLNLNTVTENYYLDNTGTPVYHAINTSGNYWCHSDYIPVKENTTYTFITNTYGNAPKICMYNKSKEFIGYLDQSETFTTISNTSYIRLNIFYPFGETKLEEGSIATNYEPYGYKIPVEITNYGAYPIYVNKQLAKIGEYSDYIDFKNQNITRAVGVYTFDGSENWEAHKENADNVVYRLDNVLTPLFNAPISATYMTHFVLTDIYSTASFTAGLYRFGFDQDKLTITSNRLYVSSDKMTVAEFKAWLSENKPTIYYPIAPTEETVELPEIPTIKGENILDINTEIKPSNVEITYKGK